MRPDLAPRGHAPPLRTGGTDPAHRGSTGLFGWSVVGLIVVGVGRITEFVPALRGAPLAKIAVALAVLAWWKDRPRPASYVPLLSTKSGRTAAALAALAVASLAFSVWRSRTLEVIFQSTAVAAEFWLIFRAVSDWRSVRRLLVTIVGAGGALAITALLFYKGGRAAVESSYDTNDLAFVLVTVLPIGYGLAVTSQGLRRTLWLALCATMVLVVILTGSRGGALGLSVVLLCLFAASATRPRRKDGKSYRRRVVIVLLVLATSGPIAWPILPSETRERLATFADLGNDYNLQSGHDSRLDIWKRSMGELLQRPIGFGMGAFGVVDAMTGGQFRAPHNSEVQIAVELGFLGLFLYLRMQWLSWVALGRLMALAQKHTSEDCDDAQGHAVLAANLRISLIGNFTAGFFLSQAYSNLIWLLLGLIAGMANAFLPGDFVRPALARDR